MKKTLICLVIVGIILLLNFLCGCDYRKMTPAEIAERDRTKYENRHNCYVNHLKRHIEVIEWNGHSYVVYHKCNKTTYGYVVDVVSMTHNPDCKCLKINKSE